MRPLDSALICDTDDHSEIVLDIATAWREFIASINKRLLGTPTNNCLVNRPFIPNATLAYLYPEALDETRVKGGNIGRCAICLTKTSRYDHRYYWPKEFARFQIGQGPKYICRTCFVGAKYGGLSTLNRLDVEPRMEAWAWREYNSVTYWEILAVVNAGLMKTEGYYISSMSEDPRLLVESTYNRLFSTNMRKGSLPQRTTEIIVRAPAFMPYVRRAVSYLGRLAEMGALTEDEKQFYDSIKNKAIFLFPERTFRRIVSILANHFIGSNINHEKEWRLCCVLNTHTIGLERQLSIHSNYISKLEARMSGLPATPTVVPQTELYEEFVNYNPKQHIAQLIAEKIRTDMALPTQLS